LSSDVEEDEEEIECDDTQESIDFRNRALFLEVIQGGVFGELQERLATALHGTTDAQNIDRGFELNARISTWSSGRHGNLPLYRFGKYFPELCPGTTL
jgi:hypothetical protein